LDTNVSEDRAASIFTVEVRGDGKVEMECGQGTRKGRGKVG